MAPGLKDIAKLANVDIGTVSHVLNNHPKTAKLRPETRKRILAAVKETGYRPNRLAQAVKSGHSRILGIISNNIGDDECMGRIISGVLEVLAGKGYALRVFSLTENNHNEIIREIMEQRIEAVFFHSPGHRDFEDVQYELQKMYIPCATMDISNRLYGIGVVSGDKEVVPELIRYALDKGYKNFCGPLKSKDIWEFQQRRSAGFAEGIAKYAAEIDQVIDFADADWEHLPEKCAIICQSDQQALWILQKPHWTRDDFSSSRYGICGFGDALMVRWGLLPLTSVNQNHREIGQKAANMLVDWLENGNEELFNKVENKTITSRIIPRESM